MQLIAHPLSFIHHWKSISSSWVSIRIECTSKYSLCSSLPCSRFSLGFFIFFFWFHIKSFYPIQPFQISKWIIGLQFAIMIDPASSYAISFSRTVIMCCQLICYLSLFHYTDDITVDLFCRKMSDIISIRIWNNEVKTRKEKRIVKTSSTIKELE